jgi:tetratricopeptide (TPR) repeat protein
MSLLAELLSKIKQPRSKREIPPNLKNIVLQSARQAGNRKKLLLLSFIFIVAVIAGITAAYVGRSFLETTSSLTVPARTVDSGAEGIAQPSDETHGDIKSAAPAKEAHSTGPSQAVIADRTDMIPREVRTPENTADTAETATPAHAGLKEEIPASIPREKEEREDRIERDEISGAAMAEPSKTDARASARDALLYAARKYELSEDYASALTHYKNALKIDSGSVTVMNNIAFIYLQLNLPEDAIGYARMALDKNGEFVPALINLAIAHAQLENYIDAERFLHTAYNLDSDNETVLLNLAILNERRMNYAEASDYYSRLVRLGNTEGALGEARIDEKQGNIQEAITRYNRIAASEVYDDRTKMKARQRVMMLLRKNRRDPAD